MYQVDIDEKKLTPLQAASLPDLDLKERYDLQEWVADTPEILGEDLLVLAKEEVLPSGKRLDLLCLDRSSNLVIVELKRDDSGSSVEWQAIKYASYCSNFTASEIFEMLARYMNASELDAQKTIEEFIEEDIERLNSSQRIILVSKDFHSEVVSAVLWLNDQGLNVQCTKLTPYTDSKNQLFLKPEVIIPLPEAKDYIERKKVRQRSIANQIPEWTGYLFVNVGDGSHRTWEDSRKYGFVSAGQGARVIKAIKRLKAGDKIYGYLKGAGYVAFGVVLEEAKPIRDFQVNGKGLLDYDLKAENPTHNVDDLEFCEWVAAVDWQKSVDRKSAKTFSGIFANQNVVCKLRQEKTLEFVQKEFGK